MSAGLKGRERDQESRSRGLSTRGRGSYEGEKPPVFTIVDRGTGQRYVVRAERGKLLVVAREHQSVRTGPGEHRRRDGGLGGLVDDGEVERPGVEPAGHARRRADDVGRIDRAVGVVALDDVALGVADPPEVDVERLVRLVQGERVERALVRIIQRTRPDEEVVDGLVRVGAGEHAKPIGDCLLDDGQQRPGLAGAGRPVDTVDVASAERPGRRFFLKLVEWEVDIEVDREGRPELERALPSHDVPLPFIATNRLDGVALPVVGDVVHQREDRKDRPLVVEIPLQSFVAWGAPLDWGDGERPVRHLGDTGLDRERDVLAVEVGRGVRVERDQDLRVGVEVELRGDADAVSVPLVGGHLELDDRPVVLRDSSPRVDDLANAALGGADVAIAPLAKPLSRVLAVAFAHPLDERDELVVEGVLFLRVHRRRRLRPNRFEVGVVVAVARRFRWVERVGPEAQLPAKLGLADAPWVEPSAAPRLGVAVDVGRRQSRSVILQVLSGERRRVGLVKGKEDGAVARDHRVVLLEQGSDGLDVDVVAVVGHDFRDRDERRRVNREKSRDRGFEEGGHFLRNWELAL